MLFVFAGKCQITKEYEWGSKEIDEKQYFSFWKGA